MVNILFADDHLLVVEKPVGVLSQTDPQGKDSLPRRLAEEGMPVYPVQRLDRETGGVMVYARTPAAAKALSALVGRHDRFVKTYRAVVGGCPTPPEGAMDDLLYHDARRNKSYTVNRPRAGVREAHLTYRVLQTAQEMSLVEVRLLTGRTHQIRVQFASRGMPLVGDRRYGGVGADGLALWSCRLEFPHPFSDTTVVAESLPDATRAPWSCFAKNGD